METILSLVNYPGKNRYLSLEFHNMKCNWTHGCPIRDGNLLRKNPATQENIKAGYKAIPPRFRNIPARPVIRKYEKRRKESHHAVHRHWASEKTKSHRCPLGMRVKWSVISISSCVFSPASRISNLSTILAITIFISIMATEGLLSLASVRIL